LSVDAFPRNEVVGSDILNQFISARNYVSDGLRAYLFGVWSKLTRGVGKGDLSGNAEKRREDVAAAATKAGRLHSVTQGRRRRWEFLPDVLVQQLIEVDEPRSGQDVFRAVTEGRDRQVVRVHSSGVWANR
jgi:hypothetical protein